MTVQAGNWRGRVLQFAPNRVWRTYRGGLMLDKIEGRADPRDAHFPEDWVGSVTRAVNPGREEIVEGPAHVLDASGKAGPAFADVLQADADYFLGAAHAQAYGPRPHMLVKLLDAAERLHLQVHPSAEFARRHSLGDSGKAEAYHILDVRPGIREPFIYMGFQRPPSRAQLKKWIETQDIAALEQCFDKIPVRRGDTLYIPAGYPHAIGEGILMVEVMEPSDLAVRFEFKRGDFVLPESARFMGRGLDFCLDVFDMRPTPAAEVRERFFFSPRDARDLGPRSTRAALFGAETTPCFSLDLTTVGEPVDLPPAGPFFGVVTQGSVRIRTPRGEAELGRFDRFFVPAGLEGLRVEPGDEGSTILECHPPAAR